MFLRSVEVKTYVLVEGINNPEREGVAAKHIQGWGNYLAGDISKAGGKEQVIVIPFFESGNIFMDILRAIRLDQPLRTIGDVLQIMGDALFNNLTNEMNVKVKKALNDRGISLSGGEGGVLILNSGAGGPGKKLVNISGYKIPTIMMIGKTDIVLDEVMNKYTKRVIAVEGDNDPLPKAPYDNDAYNVETIKITLNNTGHGDYFTQEKQSKFLAGLAQKADLPTKDLEKYLDEQKRLNEQIPNGLKFEYKIEKGN